MKTGGRPYLAREKASEPRREANVGNEGAWRSFQEVLPWPPRRPERPCSGLAALPVAHICISVLLL